MKIGFYSKDGINFFSFGKYKHKSVKHIYQTDKDYIIWIKRNTNTKLPEEIEKELIRLNINK